MRRPEIKDLLSIIAQYEVVHKELSRTQKVITHGEVDFYEMKIYIDPRQTNRDMLSTLIHEAIHVYYNDYGIDPSEKKVISEERRIMNKLYD